MNKDIPQKENLKKKKTCLAISISDKIDLMLMLFKRDRGKTTYK